MTPETILEDLRSRIPSELGIDLEIREQITLTRFIVQATKRVGIRLLGYCREVETDSPWATQSYSKWIDSIANEIKESIKAIEIDLAEGVTHTIRRGFIH